jgi:CRISPR-associated endonuclease Csy4
MKFYHEITVLPNHEIGEYFIWSRLFTQIHLSLVSNQDEEKKSPIGVSFPEYFMGEKFGVIGSKLRLFAQNESDLKKLDIQKWLLRLTDYIHISGIREVPQKINGYAIYNRLQPKVNKERLMRRHQKRQEEWKSIISDLQSQPEKVAIAQKKLSASNQRINDYNKEKTIKEPFIKLKSLSSDNDFCLWIKKTATNELNYQKFSTYGLSGFSSLPEF